VENPIFLKASLCPDLGWDDTKIWPGSLIELANPFIRPGGWLFGAK
jgi:hypothetical protein